MKSAKVNGRPPDPAGKYRIRAVSELSGVTSATLRAWERRYGVPRPTRTASAYRLYSDVDVEVVRSMRALIERGVSAAEAARTALTAVPAVPAATAAARRSDDAFESAREAIVAGARAIDPESVTFALRRALAMGSAVEIYDHVIGPAAFRIGELWHAGEVTIAGEHLATQLMIGTLGHLLDLVQAPEGSRTVLAACFADEDHLIGLYGAALHFASWGFRVHVLGQRTPPVAVARAVETLAPSLVALSCVAEPAPARARELVDAYGDACRNVCWVVGGGGAATLRARIEARSGIVIDGAPEAARTEIERAVAAHRRHARTPKSRAATAVRGARSRGG